MALNDPLTDLCPRIGFTPRFANPAAEISGSHGGVFACREVLMSTFTPPRTLPQRITDALAALRTLREQGTPSDVKKAANVLDSLLDRYPRRSTAQE